MKCPKCGSENVSVTTNTVVLSKSRSFLWNLIMTVLSWGFWLIWMLVRKRKEEKVTETWVLVKVAENVGKLNSLIMLLGLTE